jgi:glucan phosphorylase
MEINSTTIAYFSAEIGISASLPTYSGGLGEIPISAEK